MEAFSIKSIPKTIMKLFETIDYEIPAELSEFVLAVAQVETALPVRASMPMLPTGFPLLIYIYADIPNLNIQGKSFAPTKVPLNLAGQIDILGIQMEVNGTFGQIGLVLHPLTPYYLFHMSGGSLLNCWKDLLEALPDKTRTYFESISKDMEPTTIISSVLEAMKHLVEHRIEPIAWLDQTLMEIFAHNGVISLVELVRKSKLGERHFRRKFKEIVGVTPKYYCKVIQLNSVFEIIKSGSSEKLHSLALDCGYYDQAHFINDFNKFIGESPGRFLNGEYVHLKSYLGRTRA